MKVKIETPLLSVNAAWKGRRYKTDAYKVYEKKLLVLLPKQELPNPPYVIFYEFGMSNMRMDFDNPVKMLTDILQKKYDFNDCDIHAAHIRKYEVPKGEECFSVRMESLYSKVF